jgi:hypothetical protein
MNRRRATIWVLSVIVAVSLMLDGPSAVAHYQADRRDNSFVIIANESVVDALNELQAHVLSGPILASVITASRDEAIHKALPIPAHIRRQLTGYASEDSMNRVRYKINNDSSFSLAYLLEHGGFADAVTLIDVVVFRDPRVAASPCAWAHDLPSDMRGIGGRSKVKLMPKVTATTVGSINRKNSPALMSITNAA